MWELAAGRLRMRNAIITGPLCAALVVVGCASVERHPVPVDLMDRAEIAGMPGVRSWVDRHDPNFHADFVESVRLAMAEGLTGDANGRPCFESLVVSGGGAYGAFGAGFLNGWTEVGTRPAFNLVTGISTGALIAPFAFLGPQYDAELERLYSGVRNRDIFSVRSPFTMLSRGSVAKSTPLEKLIERTVTDDLIDRIAVEHSRGRRLYVATTNLDAQRLVVWNMGAIAASSSPEAIALFRDVLLASASIPVGFPPVYIPVVADGVLYDEMHVDGGLVAQFFLWGALVDTTDAIRELRLDPTLGQEATIHIIRNDKMGPAPENVGPGLVPIAARSISTMIKSVATADLLRIRRFGGENGPTIRYVGIPEDFDIGEELGFNPAQMQRLFDLGRQMALPGDSWRTEPPVGWN